MKLAIDHYLAVLRERDELEVLLRNLLIVDGFTVIKVASRGKREFGVDVAAYKRQSDGYHLYLFQVKSGDLNRTAWNDGVNSVRTSLTEALDKPFAVFADLPSQPVRRHIIVVFNGYEKDDVKDLVSNFAIQETASRPGTSISLWNQSVLVTKVEESLVSEGLMPNVEGLVLKKALAFADVPHYPFDELKTILHGLTARTTASDASRVRRLFTTARMISKMIAAYARQGGTYKNAVLSSEITILHLASWCQENAVFTPTAKEMVDLLLNDYALELQSFMAKLRPLFDLKHGLYIGGTSELLEYPLRTFEVLGLASIFALLSIHLGLDGQRQAALAVDRIIGNNPSSQRPLLDNHGVPICLAALVYMYSLEPSIAANYAIRVLDHLAVRKKLERPLPELRNDLDAVTEAIASGKKPIAYIEDSSTIIPMLFEFLLLMDEESGAEAYDAYRETFTSIDLQHWYPPSNYGEKVFGAELHGGMTETEVQLPANFLDFRKEVLERHRLYSLEWPLDTFSNRVNGFVLLIAFRHFQTPVFPHLWRQFIQGEIDS